MDRAISSNRQNFQAPLLQGLIDSQRDNYASAEKHFRKAIELQEENDTYYFYHRHGTRKTEPTFRYHRGVEKVDQVTIPKRKGL